MADGGESFEHLLKAARNGDRKELERVLSCGVHYTDKGFLAVLEASRSGNAECVSLLLEKAQNDFATPEEILEMIDGDETPLEAAIEGDHWRVVDALSPLFSGVSSAELNSALMLACEGQDAKCLEVIANRLPHILDEPFDDGFHALHEVVSSGNLKAVEILVKAGVDINAKCCDGKSALHLVCYENQDFGPEIVKFLLENNADPNVRDKKSETPLHYAAANGFADIIKLLLDGGADPGIRDGSEYIPLVTAMQYSQIQSVKALSDVTPTELQSEAVIHAAMERDCECLNYLFARGFETFVAADDDEYLGWQSILFGISWDFEEDPDERISAVTRILLENGTKFDKVAKSTDYYLPMFLLESARLTLKTFCDFGLVELFLGCDRSNGGTWVLCDYGFCIFDDRFREILDCLTVFRKDFGVRSVQIPLCGALVLSKYYPFASLDSDSSLSKNEIVFEKVVPTLANVCRWNIRCLLICKHDAVFPKHVSMLSLPEALKKYLLFK